MAARMLVTSARTRTPPWRKNISFTERAAAKAYGQGLRRCVGQNKYGEKVNPIDAIERESEFIARFRFPKEFVRKISEKFGESPFWGKKNDPSDPCCKKYVNAQWVVGIIQYI